MKPDSVVPADRSPIRLYKKIMSTIEFMEKYLEDPDIFNPDSPKFKNFLIQSFCFLYPDFHYLSFLSKEDIDLEIIKVGEILQILPANTRKISKLFDNMTKDDVHKFWLKFFTLFKKQNDFSTDSLFGMSWESKINFFKDMTSTLNYLNYEFPVVNMNKLNGVNVNKEIENWKEELCNAEVASDDLASCGIIEEEAATEFDIQKLTKGLKQIALMYSNQKCVDQQNEPEYTEFFNDFISRTKNILQYKKNLTIINSASFLNEFNLKIFSNEENLLDNLFFIKRCNNFIKTLRTKVKLVY